jgi:hypothetical protein
MLFNDLDILKHKFIEKSIFQLVQPHVVTKLEARVSLETFPLIVAVTASITPVVPALQGTIGKISVLVYFMFQGIWISLRAFYPFEQN